MFEIPAGARKVTAARAGGAAIWTLAIGEARLFPEIDALVAAGKRGDAAAAARLRALRDDPDPELRVVADGGYGRVMLARGEMTEAEPALRRALAGARATGGSSDEMRDGRHLIWALAEQQQRFADARAVLGSLTRPRSGYPEGEAFTRTAKRCWRSRRAIPGALAQLPNGGTRMGAVGAHPIAQTTPRGRGDDLTTLGRFDEAVATFEQLPAKADRLRAGIVASIGPRHYRCGVAAAGQSARLRVLAALAEEQRETGRCPIRAGGCWRRFTRLGGRSPRRSCERRSPCSPAHRSRPAPDSLLSGAPRGSIGRWLLARGEPAMR